MRQLGFSTATVVCFFYYISLSWQLRHGGNNWFYSHPIFFYTFSVTVVVPECEKSSATTYFWYRQTLNITSSIDDTGGLNWKMTVSLLVAWILVCMAVIKGIQSSGKVWVLLPSTAGAV